MEFLRRRLGLIFRILVSALVVIWLARNIQWQEAWDNIRTMDLKWIVAGFFCFTPVLLIVSWRWRMLLGVHGVHIPFWRVFELTMIGQFFSTVGVGTTGGDVVKIFYAARAVPQRRAAVAFTIIVDRVIGLVALLLFGTALSLPYWSLFFSQHGTRVATVTFYFFALGGVVASILACFGPFVLRSQALRALINKLPFIHRIEPLFMAYEHTAKALGINLLALVGSLPSHVCGMMMGYCILRAMHLPHPPDFLMVCAIIAIVNMLIALPIAISGVGVREILFKMYLGLVGIDAAHAIPFSLTFFGLSILWCLIGGPFYFLYRHQTHTPAPDVAEVDPLFSDQ
jgi:uncharacterized protein (TIRG00374 family)